MQNIVSSTHSSYLFKPTCNTDELLRTAEHVNTLKGETSYGNTTASLFSFFIDKDSEVACISIEDPT